MSRFYPFILSTDEEDRIENSFQKLIVRDEDGSPVYEGGELVYSTTDETDEKIENLELNIVQLDDEKAELLIKKVFLEKQLSFFRNILFHVWNIFYGSISMVYVKKTLDGTLVGPTFPVDGNIFVVENDLKSGVIRVFFDGESYFFEDIRGNFIASGVIAGDKLTIDDITGAEDMVITNIVNRYLVKFTAPAALVSLFSEKPNNVLKGSDYVIEREFGEIVIVVAEKEHISLDVFDNIFFNVDYTPYSSHPRDDFSYFNGETTPEIVSSTVIDVKKLNPDFDPAEGLDPAVWHSWLPSGESSAYGFLNTILTYGELSGLPASIRDEATLELESIFDSEKTDLSSSIGGFIYFLDTIIVEGCPELFNDLRSLSVDYKSAVDSCLWTSVEADYSVVFSSLELLLRGSFSGYFFDFSSKLYFSFKLLESRSVGVVPFVRSVEDSVESLQEQIADLQERKDFFSEYFPWTIELKEELVE